MSKQTPEGVVKDLVKDMLFSIGCVRSSKADKATVNSQGWFHMPVSNGMGVHGIPDFIGHYRGHFFVAETKKNEKSEPTALQKIQLDAVNLTGGLTWVIRCQRDVDLMKQVLLSLGVIV